MVKNTTGGSKHKGMARKLVNAPVNDKIRLPEDECECYGKVIKMLGNGMCHVNLVYKDKLYEIGGVREGLVNKWNKLK